MKHKIQDLTKTALMTALTCIFGPVVIPIGVVPMSFANLAIYLTILLMGRKKASISVAIYLLIGLVGMPVFSGFSGGAGKLFGPTGGYLIGYLALCQVAGSILERVGSEKNKKKKKLEENKKVGMEKWFRSIKEMFALSLGTVFLYFFGTVWFMMQSSMNFVTSLTLGVVPFIVFDIIKMIIAVFLANAIKQRADLDILS